MKRILFSFFMLLLVMITSGCGFGGFSGSGSATQSQNVATKDNFTKISGLASKGPFNNGTVKLYDWSGDGTTQFLKSTPVTVFGNYSASISATRPTTSFSTGTVLLEASGSYTDEATGEELSIPETAPLRAAIPNATGEITAVVTPLTELAVRVIGNQPTSSAVTAANKLISDIFKVNILGVLPAAPTAEVFGHSGTYQTRKDYGLALAALSVMAQERGSLESVLSYLASNLIDGALSPEAAADFHRALLFFLASDKNATGFTDIALTNLVNAGGTVRTVKLRTLGILDSLAAINTITIDVELPPYATLRADFLKPEVVPFSGVVVSSGVVPGERYVESRYYPATADSAGRITLSLINVPGFGLGEFATLKVDIAAGATLSAADFKNIKFEAKDGYGNTLPEIGAEAFLE